MKVSDFVEGKLMEIGATPEYTGYKYLVCAIVMSMQNEYLLNNVTTKMYPAIGKRYAKFIGVVSRRLSFYCRRNAETSKISGQANI